MGQVLDLAGVAPSENTELLQELGEDHINRILWEARLSAPDANGASLGAGALKAALNQQLSPRCLREASTSKPSSPNPR